jgi:hypothetical protein
MHDWTGFYAKLQWQGDQSDGSARRLQESIAEAVCWRFVCVSRRSTFRPSIYSDCWLAFTHCLEPFRLALFSFCLVLVSVPPAPWPGLWDGSFRVVLFWPHGQGNRRNDFARRIAHPFLFSRYQARPGLYYYPRLVAGVANCGVSMTCPR